MTTIDHEATSHVHRLRRCRLFESAAEPEFDDPTRLGAQLCSTPVALLGFVEGSREWIKARHRWNVSFFPKEVSFAWPVVNSGEIVVVNNLATDPRFASNPLVVGEPRVRFYAGAPVFDPAGNAIGALQVFDQRPREFTDHHVDALNAVARTITATIASRMRLAQLEDRVAELEETREALRDSQERFRDLFESADDVILNIANDGRYLHMNRAWYEMLGYGEKEAARLYVVDTIPPDERGQFLEAFNRVVATARPERIETHFLSNDGRRITVEGRLSPKVVEGRTVFVRVIFRDITERKRIEIELSKSRDEALGSARIKQRFLTNMSHEIRTPMHGVDGMIGLLLDTQLSPEQREFALAARTSADSLLAIVNNILHVSQLESGKLSAVLTDFDLFTMVERVVEVMKVAGSARNVDVRATFDSGLPAVVRGDVARVRQVLTNLLNNAIKFTEKGSVEIAVQKDRETDSHLLVRFSISDTGVGIEERDRAQLFQTFFQADTSTTRVHSGTGLGLAISKQLVELMGGAIDVESEPGRGSTFWFTIPFEKRQSERLTIEASRLAFPGTRVLVLDDNEISRRVVMTHLASFGMRARWAATPTEALERLRSEMSMGDPYRALIFNLHLGTIEGVDLAQIVKADHTIANTPMIAITSLAEQVDDQLLRQSGIAAYLSKPVEKSELLDALAIALASLRLKTPPEPVAAKTAGTFAPLRAEAKSRARILIAEDKPLNQKLTLGQLKTLGFAKADVVSNGLEVVNACNTNHYDVILMDCQMPIMDGYEATMEIRKREKNGRRTKIIAMTAHALEGERERCLAAGMDDYLSKPTRQEDLNLALTRWLQ